MQSFLSFFIPFFFSVLPLPLFSVCPSFSCLSSFSSCMRISSCLCQRQFLFLSSSSATTTISSLCVHCLFYVCPLFSRCHHRHFIHPPSYNRAAGSVALTVLWPLPVAITLWHLSLFGICLTALFSRHPGFVAVLAADSPVVVRRLCRLYRPCPTTSVVLRCPIWLCSSDLARPLFGRMSGHLRHCHCLYRPVWSSPSGCQCLASPPFGCRRCHPICACISISIFGSVSDRLSSRCTSYASVVV